MYLYLFVLVTRLKGHETIELLYSNNNIIVRYCTPCQPKIDRSIDHNILWQYIQQQQQYVKLEEEITSSSIERNRKQCQITPGLVISR